jgi:hypothetical protein
MGGSRWNNPFSGGAGFKLPGWWRSCSHRVRIGSVRGEIVLFDLMDLGHLQ